jgi:hypothetical protein
VVSKRMIVLTIALLLGSHADAQDAGKIFVHIKAVLLDRDLNQKPVGKSKFHTDKPSALHQLTPRLLLAPTHL